MYECIRKRVKQQESKSTERKKVNDIQKKKSSAELKTCWIVKFSAEELKEMKLCEGNLNYLYTIRDFKLSMWSRKIIWILLFSDLCAVTARKDTKWMHKCWEVR